MPWNQTSPMDQRTQFIADYLRKVLSVTELCDLYGVSRKTAYKWIDRYLRQGPAGLEERSRRRQGSPNQTAEEIVAAILEARTPQAHPYRQRRTLCYQHLGPTLQPVGLVGAAGHPARAHRAGETAAERPP